MLMSAKGYREKKALPLVRRLKDAIKNLTLQVINALSENERLSQLIRQKNSRISGLENRIDKLKEENESLKQRTGILDLVERAVGREQVREIAAAQSEQEDWEKRQRRRQKTRSAQSL